VSPLAPASCRPSTFLLLLQAQDATATFLLLCRSNCTIEVYSLPCLGYVAMFLSMHEGEATVPSVDPAAMVCLLLSDARSTGNLRMLCTPCLHMLAVPGQMCSLQLCCKRVAGMQVGRHSRGAHVHAAQRSTAQHSAAQHLAEQHSAGAPMCMLHSTSRPAPVTALQLMSVSCNVQESMPLRPPLATRIGEIRLDSFPCHPDAKHHPLGAVPAREVLTAERPLLLLRAHDERLYIYRLQLNMTTDDPARMCSQLCLHRQPFDWLQYAFALLTSVSCVQGDVILARGHLGSPHNFACAAQHALSHSGVLVACCACVCRRLPARESKQPCGNPASAMVRFDNISVEFGISSGTALALHQGVFVCGEKPVWLLAHRGEYRAHMMNTQEHSATPGASSVHTGVAAMAGWHTQKAPSSFVVVSWPESELRFCHMSKNVRHSLCCAALHVCHCFCRSGSLSSQ
jgi:hypothetical protein